MSDKLELLSPDLLDEERPVVTAIAGLARELRVGLGWHYLLDLAWILRGLPIEPGMTVLDAGAGYGILQWYLSDRGVKVVSVDRSDRASVPLRFRSRYPVRGLQPGDVSTVVRSLGGEVRRGRPAFDSGRYARGVFERLTRSETRRKRGTVTFHRSELGRMDMIPSESIDQIVAVSALEHNDPQELPGVVQELLRVLRPGGSVSATLGASATHDWFHEPSRGWCYTEPTLRHAFGLPEGVSSNYGRYDDIMSAVRASAELRDNLAALYFRSGNNGMPWGKWDPQYLSVGVLRSKNGHEPVSSDDAG
jgi:SAM-dependent methyltransferase